MESQDETICHQCPCSRIRTECTEFEKIVDLSDAGVVIYRHSTRVDEAIYLASDFEIKMTNNDVFIIHNTKEAEVTSADIVPVLVQNKVDCPRCQHIMDHAQRLLQNVSIVDKQDVIGICDHCKTKGKYRPCVDCTKIVKKFMTSVHIRGDYEETKERLKAWLKKIQTMLKGVSSDDEKGSKVKSHSQTDLRVDKLRQYSKRAVHVPDVEQMLRPKKYRPTSSKVAPGPEFVYFEGRDEISLIDTEPAKVKRTGKDDLVQAEKATLKKDHVPKTKELELSSDKLIILDQKKSDMIALGPKTVTKAKLPKDLSAEVSTIKLPKDVSAEVSERNSIKSDRTKPLLAIKGALKKPKLSESRLRTRKYHSEEDLTTNIANVRKQDSKITKKGFKYFFPKESKAKRPKSDLSSSVLIKDTLDRLKDQSGAPKRKAEENEKKMFANEERKKTKMDEQKAKLVEGGDDGKKVKADVKKVKADDKKEISKEPEVNRKAEARREAVVSRSAKTEDRLPLDNKDVKKVKADDKKEISKEPEVNRKAEARREAVVSRPAKTEDRLPLENKDVKKVKADDKKEISKEPEVNRKAEARREAVVSRPAKTEDRLPLENKDVKKVKADDKKEISKEPEVNRKAEARREAVVSRPAKTEDRLPLENKDVKQVKADDKKEISKEPEVNRKAEARREAVVSRSAKMEDRLPLENKGKLKPKSQTRESKTGKILQDHISKEPKTEKVDSVERFTLEKLKSSDKRSVTDDNQQAIPKDATGTKKQDAPLKDKDSKTKSEKADQLSKAKDRKQKDSKTEMDMFKKALASQQSKTKETKQTPQQEEVELKITEIKNVKEKEIVPIVFIDQEVSKKKKEDKETSDASKKGKDEAELLKKALDAAKQKKEEFKMKKTQEDAKKPRELAEKKAEDASKASETGNVPPSAALKTASEQSALNATALKKDLDIKEIEAKQPLYDDLILRLVEIKKAATIVRQKRALGQPVQLADLKCSPSRIKRHKGHFSKASTCEICHDSDLEFDLDSFFKGREIEEQAGFAEMILGEKIIKKIHKPPMKKEGNMAPVLFMSTFDELSNKMQSETVPNAVSENEPSPNTTALKSRTTAVDLDRTGSKGVIRYALSDRQFIEKGWTLLPTEKVVRKMNVYRMRPAHPEFNWFERNKNKRLIPYDTGEKFAEFDDNGRGRWFYKNGRLALDYYDAEETNAQQRFVIYSSGEPDERGRSRPVTVLATFDYIGNGVVFDHGGKIRLKYNQTEGVVLDRGIGPVSHWKWHTLNDPPVLQQVMIDTQMAHKDPDIVKLGGSAGNKTGRPDNEDMLAIEFDNFIKEKSKKSSQKFKPFQIKMKALKINEQFSLRVLDQATVYLIFREGSANIKLNIGMLLDHQEIVDTDTAEVGEVSNNVERFPARSDSLAALQNSVTFAQHYERMRTERERRLRPPEPSASADKLTAGTSRPLRPPLMTVPAAAANPSPDCRCKTRKPSTINLYYDTRLI